MTLAHYQPCHDPANAVEFDRVTRTFVLQHERNESLQDWFIHLVRRDQQTTEAFAALDNVSFAIRRGETVGLIGRNGAGKSTLLKLVTGILEPSAGEVRVSGRVYAMLELGAGFHPELSGRDNIYLNGAIYGFGRKAMRRKYERIVEFAELEHFIDTPVKHYSSGMFMRLGFATAIHMDPEVLVVDEVMAVGDSAFRRKCHDAIRELQRQGVTILLVSHDSEEVREFCQRVVLLADGKVVADGPTEPVLTEYARLQLRVQETAALTASAPAPGGDHAQVRFGSVVLRDGAGQPTRTSTHDTPLTVDLLILGDTRAPLTLQLRWRTQLGVLLFEGWEPVQPVQGAAARRVRCHFPAFPLRTGEALLEVALCDPAKGVTVDTAEAHLLADGPPGPLFEFAHQWEQHAEPGNGAAPLTDQATPGLIVGSQPR